MFVDRRLTEPVFLHSMSHAHHAVVESGWLSIKSMWQGEAVYRLEHGRVTLDNRCYLILNDQQPYTIEIDHEDLVESFCIFFPARWAGDVWRTFITPTDHLLAEPDEETAVSFYDVLHRHDQLVTPLLQMLRRESQIGREDAESQTEMLHDLLAAMLEVQCQVHQEAAKLPAVRTTTRKELYRRLHIGREFIHGHLHESLSLEEIAQAAALSPYHFLRSFKQLFGQTPHTYLTQQRLEQAQRLLTASDLPVTEICAAVGFQSLGSFSTLFQRHSGRSPSQFRQDASL